MTTRVDDTPVPAVRALSFDLAPGKILGLVGESGAGKSMVGRAIAQLLPAGFRIASGAISFEGRDLIRTEPARRRALLGRSIAFVPQAPLTALNPVMTIGAQLDEHLARLGGRTRAERRHRAIAMLAAAELSNAAALLEQYPHQLSLQASPVSSLPMSRRPRSTSPCTRRSSGCLRKCRSGTAPP
ncbi:MAG: ABC transporter ATP-binding protein [Alphaproteobacteria bacterium]|nr:MAG: ABC transporter ATP-binding protein [Alphaproteobacteria bacterium]